MKRHHILGLAFLAIFAFSAVLAASASAETTLLAEWLLNGVGITTLTSTDIEGLLTLINNAGIGGIVKLHCEDILDGSVGANGEDEITEVLNLAGVKIGTNLTGTSLLCKTENATIGCGGTGSEAEVWPDNLPWLSSLFLMENASFLDDLFGTGAGKEPGYEVLCLATGIENLCEGLSTSIMTNVAGGVLGEFIENSETQTCTIGTGTLLGSGTILPTGGGTLTVSSV